MKCYEVDTKLMDYLYGELSGGEKGVLQAHLKGCLQCAKKINELKTSQNLLQALPDEEVPMHLRHEFWKEKQEVQSSFNVWSRRIASITVGFVLGVFSFYLVKFHIVPHAFESKAIIVATNATQEEPPSETSVPNRQFVSQGNIENENVESVSLGATGGTRSSFGEPQEIPASPSIRTRWFATKPFMMKEGQQAVLPSQQAKIFLKDILYSPCTEYVTKCTWSGVGAIYEFYNQQNSQAQTFFMKKTNQGYPIQMKLNDSFLLEVWDISPTAVRTVIKTSQ